LDFSFQTKNFGSIFSIDFDRKRVKTSFEWVFEKATAYMVWECGHGPVDKNEGSDSPNKNSGSDFSVNTKVGIGLVKAPIY
jgi:hypothetical protein